MRSIKADIYDEAFRLWDMAPIAPTSDYGPAGSLYRFADATGVGEYWVYFRDNLFAVNAFQMKFTHAGTMRYRHAEHLCIGYYDQADLVVQNSPTNPRDGSISAYVAREGAEYVAHYRPGALTRATSITITPDYYRDYLHARFGDIPDMRRAFALVDGRRDFPELVALFKQIRAYRGEGMAAELFYEGAVAEALALIIKRAADIEREGDAHCAARALTPADQAALDEIERYIASHLADELSCEVLARRACMGQTKFKAAFKRRFGAPPAAYVQNARMSCALDLLRTTDEPIARIACAVGYHKPGAFTEAFKRRTGIPPSAFRPR